MFPKYSDILEPLLIELYKRGGESKPSSINDEGKTIYDALADFFGLSEEARNFKIYEKNGAERSKWYNMIRWVRNDLKKAGFLYTPRHGIWALTDKGKSLAEKIDKEKVVSGEGDALTEIDIETFLKLKADTQEIGNLGEAYVLEYERHRLNNIGCSKLAGKVIRVSLINVGAGYDIKSYEKNGEERFIEVKTTIGDASQFQLTFNEYKTAKKYGQQYWIYFVRLTNNSIPDITMINNPIKKEKDGTLLFRPSSFWVTITDENA